EPTGGAGSDSQFESSVSFFVFFHAEAGIRDGHVTGVQTCALPICVIFIGCARNWFQMVLYHCDSAGERRQMFFPGPSMCFASKGDCTMCLGNSVLIHMESTAKENPANSSQLCPEMSRERFHSGRT